MCSPAGNEGVDGYNGFGGQIASKHSEVISRLNRSRILKKNDFFWHFRDLQNLHTFAPLRPQHFQQKHETIRHVQNYVRQFAYIEQWCV